MRYSAFNRRPRYPRFHCGFQPEGKPYQKYVAHISKCQDIECKQRNRNREALIRSLGYTVANEHQATNPTPSGAAFPNASTSTGSHRHPSRSH